MTKAREITVHVELMGSLRARVKDTNPTMQISGGATVDELLRKKLGFKAADIRYLKIAVNDAVAENDHRLRNGDRVLVMMQIAGG